MPPLGAWLHGFVTKGGAIFGTSLGLAASDGSFHPNEAGQEGYALILEQYIRDQVAAEDAQSNEAGLPLNPGTVEVSANRARSSSTPGTGLLAAKPANPATRQSDAFDGGDAGASGQSSEHTTQETAGYLAARRVAAESGCRSPFATSGEQVRLEAGGFAPGASVSFSLRAASLDGTELSGLSVPAAVADSEGLLEVLWTVPSAPPADQDAAPRAYVVDANGSGADGGTHTAYMTEPLVAYPETAPCAVSDTAATSLGRSVQVPVLANDVAPSGGSLDASSLWVQPVSGGDFVVDHATGSVTFTPDAGFLGAVAAHYWVYDSWGIGVRGDITVTVSAGCTITGTAGVVLIEGTSGDDVICVPDPEDHRAFHVIDAKGGNDTVIGGAGVEWVYGSGGDDTIIGGSGDDILEGGNGDDVLWGGSGADTLSGGAGEDTLWGGEGADSLQGNTQDDRLYGGAGDDTLVGGGEKDLIYGGPGDDTLDGHTGGDSLWGGPGVDMLRGGNGDDALWGGPGDDTLTGGAGADSLYGGSGADDLDGNTQNDTLWGGPGDDTLDGQGHDDQLHGGRGDDTLRGGARNDRVYGGPGDDTLDGGNGTDHLDGGPDADACTRGHTTAGCETEGRRR